ncbi:Hypothetical predicted protein [Mytilus galloprovincialis]|uniref:Uncharacterized protein n=1 Tax=Mytilus galloprovincialis TaxID=29158 RepID=A0A8B6GKQ8_MYTGA|nr:Hypothetical predicted protein [Mytilus galloprovincialis]
MKSQHPDAIEQTNIELRRSSRNATGNKLSRRRNAKSKSVPESEKTISLQNQSIEILHKTVSPKKQQLPVILESPSICQQQSSIGQPAAEIATPKSSKTYSFTENTPYKEDLLICSQHFDPQQDVGWDCRSPDAVNFLRKSRRRRHYSDVSDIITQLHVNTEDLHEEKPESSTTPLLGLWINDGNCFSNNNLPDPQPNRDRRKKNKTKSKSVKSKKGNDGAPEALLEKLQHVLEKCEDNEGNEKKDRRKRSLSVGDESKDLFDETSGNNNDNDSWSDDDLFEDDSFIIKATQIQVEPKCQKRKMETRKSDEPPVKLGKYIENQKSVQPSLSTAKPGLSTARLTRVTAKASPFKKHKSFNDRHEYQKSQEKNYNYAVQSKAGRPVNTTSCVLTSKQNNTIVSKQFSTVTSKPSVISTKGSSVYSTSYQVSKVLSNPCKSSTQVSTNVCTTKLNVISVCKENVTASTKSYTFYNSKPSFTMAKPGSVSQCPTLKQSYRLSNSNHGVVPSVNSTVSSQCAVTSTQSAYKISTCTSFSTRSSFVTTSKPISSVASLSNRNIVKTIASTEIPGKMKAVSHTHLKETACLQSPSSRRTSGAFDTSLSDDLLCQLVEPDEILDSQVPVCTGSDKTDHVDDALSFFHDVPQSKSGAATSVLDRQKVPNSKMLASETKINYDNNQANSSAQTLMCSNLKTSGVRKQTSSGANLSSQISKDNSKKAVQESLNSIRPNQKNYVDTMKNSCTLVKQEPKINQDSSVGNFSQTVNTISKVLTGAVKVKVERKTENNVIVKKEHVEEPAKLYSFKSRTPRSKTMSGSSASAYAMENASEDLFMSDDDELSEPQLLALLENVESTQSCSSTNARGTLLSNKVNNSVDFHGHIDEKGDKEETTENKQQTFPQAGKDYKSQSNLFIKPTPNLHHTPIGNNCQPLKSPFKCSPEDIDWKRLEAIKRKQHKTDISEKHDKVGTSGIIHSHSDFSPIKSTPPRAFSQPMKSPFKCSPEDIEKKRLEAIKRKQQKPQTGNKLCSPCNTQPLPEFSPIKSRPPKLASSQTVGSPFQCSHENIDEKQMEAVNRKQWNSDMQNKSSSNPSILDESPCKCTPRTPNKSQLTQSPFKCSPEDIEKKRRAALKRRQLKFDISGCDASQTQVVEKTSFSEPKPERHGSETSPLKCSQEDIKNKKEEALRRLQQKSAKIVNLAESTDDHESSSKHVSKTPTKSATDKSHLKCSPDDIEKKRLEALRRKQLKLHQETHTQIDNESQCDASPFKCSPEDIELKKQNAVMRKKLKFDNIDDKKNPERSFEIKKTVDDKKYTNKASDLNKISNNTNVSKTTSSQNVSPVKYSLKEEIEKKKQLALQRRLEKMNSAKNLNSS